MSNRASYQRHNPNLSLKPVNAGTKKQPVLMFKDSDGNVAFTALSEKDIKRLSRLFPSETSTQILINLLYGKTYYLPLPAFDQKISFVFK